MSPTGGNGERPPSRIVELVALLATFGLVLVALAVVIGVIVLSANGRAVPGSIVAIGAAAVAALAVARGATALTRRD